MPLSLDQFVQHLTDSGLMNAEDVAAFSNGLSNPPADAESLARQLVDIGKLTPFQAKLVWKGKAGGLVIGNYAILDKLGQGGMGVVFYAEHRRMGRKVALKVLSPKLTKDKDAVKRFHREVQAAARLTHPNIVAAFDADESKGAHFLVMEYIDGRDLSVIVKQQGPLEIDQAVSCIVQAARGLQYAHKNGVIHRDIKPANLLLDKKGNVKVLDMGLARIESTGIGHEPQTELTMTGAVMGTVDYMSPEQAEDTKAADARSDIYSLGCTWYFLLNGKPAYKADTLIKRLLAHRDNRIPALMADGSTDANVAAIDAVFRKMIAKRAVDRYQSMTEVIAALEAIRSGAQETVQTLEPVAAAMPAESAYHSFLAGLADEEPAKQTVLNTGKQTFDAYEETLADPNPPAGSPPPPPPVSLQPRTSAATRGSFVVGGTLLAFVCVGVLLWIFAGSDTPPTNDDGYQVPNSQRVPVKATRTNYTLAFDGIDDYVDIPMDGIDIGDELTIEAWIDFEEHIQPSAERGRFAYVFSTIWGKTAIDIGHGDPGHNGSLQAVAQRAGVDWQHAYTNGPISGRHHIAMVWQEGIVALYVDGRLIRLGQPIPQKFTWTSMPPFLRLGAARRLDGSPNSFFSGRIDEIRLSKTARYNKAGFTPAKRFEPDGDTISLYHCDKLTGEFLQDATGNGHHGSIHGAKWVPVKSPGKSPANYALQFDGVDDYVDIPMEGIDVGDEFTIEAWIDFEELPPPKDKYVHVVHWIGDADILLAHHRADMSEGGNLTTSVREASGRWQQAYTTWHVAGPRHVAMVWDDGLVTLYVNGRRAHRPQPVPLSPRREELPRLLQLGGTAHIGRGTFLGRIDEIRISKTARYNKAGFTPAKRFKPDDDTIALYHCDKLTGEFLQDVTGNGHHGTIVGARRVRVSP